MELFDGTPHYFYARYKVLYSISKQKYIYALKGIQRILDHKRLDAKHTSIVANSSQNCTPYGPSYIFFFSFSLAMIKFLITFPYTYKLYAAKRILHTKRLDAKQSVVANTVQVHIQTYYGLSFHLWHPSFYFGRSNLPAIVKQSLMANHSNIETSPFQLHEAITLGMIGWKATSMHASSYALIFLTSLEDL